jgi:hypothetical protein
MRVYPGAKLAWARKINALSRRSFLGALATTASAKARRAKAEAIQAAFVALDCFARARNDAERLAENFQRHCEELLRRSNPGCARVPGLLRKNSQ